MCDCIDKANEKLAEHNTRIVEAFPILPVSASKARIGTSVKIETMKIEPRKRGNARVLLATFCPFCGAKYNG